MAETLGDLAVILSATSAKFTRDIDKAKGSLAGLNKAAKAATAASAAVFAGGAMLSSKLIGAASDAAEQLNVLSIAFGGNADAVVDWAETTSDVVGRSATDLKDYAGQVGALIAPTLGVSTETKNMSQSLATLAVDLGSVFNAMETDTLQALKSGILGEVEPMKRFGVAMNVAALDAFALSKGIGKAVKDMTEAEKITLRYNFLMERTAAFQGDAARTAEGWANMSKRLKGQLTDLSAELGAGLLPYAEDIAKVLSNVIKTFTGLSDETKRWIGIVVGAVTAGAGLATVLGGLALVLPVIAAGFVTVGLPVLAIVAALGLVALAVVAMRKVWIDNVGGLRGAWEDAVDAIGGAWGKVTSFISDTWTTVVDALGKGWMAFNRFMSKSLDAIEGALVDTFNFLIGGAKKIANAISPELAKMLDGMGMFTKAAKNDVDEWATAVSKLENVEFKWEFAGGKTIDEAFTPDTSGIGEWFSALKKDASGLGDFLGEAFREAGAVLSGAVTSAMSAVGVATGDKPAGPKPSGTGAGATGTGTGAGAGTDVAGVVGEVLTNQAEQVGTAATDAAQSFVGSMGDFGSILSNAVSAGKTGGIWTALFTLITDLLKRTKGFIGIVDNLLGLVSVALEAVNPVIEVIRPLIASLVKVLVPIVQEIGGVLKVLSEKAFGPLFVAVVSLLKAVLPIIQVVLIGLQPVLGVLGDVIRGLSVAVAFIATGIGWVVNAMIDVAREFLAIIAELADVFGAGGEVRKFSHSLMRARVDVDQLWKNTRTAADGMPQFASQVTEAGEAIGGDGGLNENLSETNQRLAEVNESLLNVPEGVKVAAARFEATDAADAPGSAAIPPRVGVVNIYAGDPRDTYEKFRSFADEDRYLEGASTNSYSPWAVQREGA